MIKNILVRLIAYPLSVLLLFLSYLMFSDIYYKKDFSVYGFKIIIMGIIIAGICMVYLVSDILYQIKKKCPDKKN